MNTGRRSDFTRIELLVGIVLVFSLVAFVLPVVVERLINHPLAGTLSNARQLHLAIETLSLDTDQAGRGGLEWTTFVSRGRKTTATVGQLFDRLTMDGYLTKSQLRKLVSAPGRGPGWFGSAEENGCFKFFAVDDDSPVKQPLLVTANWDAGRMTKAEPYGKKGFVVFTKEGSGGIYLHPRDACSTDVFPTGQDAAGHAYRYDVLK